MRASKRAHASEDTRLLAHGPVAKAGRTLTVCAGDVHAFGDAAPRAMATMLGTKVALHNVAENAGPLRRARHMFGDWTITRRRSS